MKIFKMLPPGLAILMMVNSVFAQTWTQTSAPSNFWTSVASSADGTVLAAAAQAGTPTTSGHIFISTNSGLTWTETASPSNCVCVASSADGNKLVAVNNYGNVGIFTSADSGVTWTSNNVPNFYWDSIASSADGNNLVASAIIFSAGGNGGVIYTSTNSGATWTDQTNAPNYVWNCVSSSADGVRLLVMGSPDKIFTSTNSGSTWEQISNPPITWGTVSSAQVIAMSSDATRLVAAFSSSGAGNPSPIYISTNAGATWMLTSAPSNKWSSVSMSADGSRLAAVGSGVGGSGPIFTSTNAGVAWTSNSLTAQPWTSVTMSADGNKIVAAAGIFPAASIYTLQTTPTPQLNLTPTNGSFKLSWLIPSTNFVMQQSADLASWSDVTNAPVLNLTNLQNEVILPPSNSSGFYRLKTP